MTELEKRKLILANWKLITDWEEQHLRTQEDILTLEISTKKYLERLPDD